MLLRNQRMMQRNQKETERTPPKKYTKGLGAAKGQVVAIGQSTANGELGALALDALGSALKETEKQAVGYLTHGLHGRKRIMASRGMKYEDGPHYSWLPAAHEQVTCTPPTQDWSDTELPTPYASKAPATPVTESDIESAEVVIVGGGPHALAALAALSEDSKDDTTGSCCLLR